MNSEERYIINEIKMKRLYYILLKRELKLLYNKKRIKIIKQKLYTSNKQLNNMYCLLLGIITKNNGMINYINLLKKETIEGSNILLKLIVNDLNDEIILYKQIKAHSAIIVWYNNNFKNKLNENSRYIKIFKRTLIQNSNIIIKKIIDRLNDSN